MTVLNELIPLAIDGALEKLAGIYNFTNPGVYLTTKCYSCTKTTATMNSPGRTLHLKSKAKYSRLLDRITCSTRQSSKKRFLVYWIFEAH